LHRTVSFVEKSVAESGITQEIVDNMIKTEARGWCAGVGMDMTVYQHPEWDFSIRWGDWGAEHITIPGMNATGLDIDDHYNGKRLLPHNVDSLCQASLLMTIFCRFADMLVYKVIKDSIE